MEYYHNYNYSNNILKSNEKWLQKKYEPRKRKAQRNIFKIEWNKPGRKHAKE